LTSLHDEETPVKLKEAGRIAARVGDEVITHRELTEAVKEKIAGLPQGYKPNRQEIMMITSNVLDSLIERSIIIQEAKREMKKPEMIARFMGIAEKVWREEELPPLLRKMSVLNEYELKEKFKEQGKSLDEMREMWKQDFLAKGFLEQKLRPKISVEYSEMRAYYNAHLDEFNRPAAWTWREVLVEMDKHPSRAEARKKAEAILARLRHGDDFAQVAQAESEGPNRSSGGLWETHRPRRDPPRGRSGHLRRGPGQGPPHPPSPESRSRVGRLPRQAAQADRRGHDLRRLRLPPRRHPQFQVSQLSMIVRPAVSERIEV
jgi:hypothetical protein